MPKCYLNIEGDDLVQSRRYMSIRDACDDYLDTARILSQVGQPARGYIHIANYMREMCDYPDFRLSLGPKGGLVKEKM